MYVPDPIPMIDELGIGAYLLTSHQGKQVLLVMVIILVLLSLIGFPPIGMLS